MCKWRDKVSSQNKIRHFTEFTFHQASNLCVCASSLSINSPHFVPFLFLLRCLVCLCPDSWPLMTWCWSCRRTALSWTRTAKGKWWLCCSNYWRTRTERCRTWLWNGKHTNPDTQRHVSVCRWKLVLLFYFSHLVLLKVQITNQFSSVQFKDSRISFITVQMHLFSADSGCLVVRSFCC